MGEFTPAQVWAAILAVAMAIVTIANAVEKIVKAVQAAKAPNVKQDARIKELEDWRKEVEAKLKNDKQQLDEIHEGLRASYQAQLALLDHGIDGNNIEQMQGAKAALQLHLINR